MSEPLYRANVLVCGGTGCEASGSATTYQMLVDEVQRRGLADEVQVIHTGCRGFCAMGPIVIVYPEGIFYCQVHGDDIPLLVEETLVKGRIVSRLTYKEPTSHEGVPFYGEIPFYKKQLRIILRNCGMINPENIEEYIARDGYQALIKVLSSMTPAQVIDEVKSSKLRGRGGAGFLVGLKWELTARAAGDVKYVVCNADEGDPGAFMDRSLIEGDPHSLLEGMAICGYSVGASEGYVYCRAEYPLAIKRLKLAITQAEEYGLLGDNILGTDFCFHLHIKEGAGAFVCGEETALLASIEGRRGEPRPRPPFPAVSGLWNKPTNLNNVKSYCNVPQIIVHGAEWFANIGTPRSPGTAIFALTGKVNNTGLVEVPMGIPLRKVVFDIGGGIPEGLAFKAVQTGGPSGGCIPARFLDEPVDYESLAAVGSIMGSGGMIVADERTCVVDFSRFFLEFVQDESCGKCVPCRIGTKRMLEILEDICAGRGREEDLGTLQELASAIKDTALCGLGQTAPNPVLTTMKYFAEEYRAHISERKCPAKACKALIRYDILADKCTGCTACYKACPADAVTGERKKVHEIHQDKCIKCGACYAACRFDAITIT